MAAKKIIRGGKARGKAQRVFKTSLKVGDPVVVLTGGNRLKGKLQKGQTGEILRFVPKRNRVIVSGINLITRHKKASRMGESGGKIVKEGSVHISNVLYYVKDIKKAVRLKHQLTSEGKNVRGYLNPESKEFVRLD